jgi:hypothetical protein
VKNNTLFNLLYYRFTWLAVARTERLVVAVRTSTNTKGSIAIGTSKTSIDGEFLHTTTESFPYVIGVTIEPSLIAPGKYHSSTKV